MGSRLRVVRPDEAPPPPSGFSVLELDCRRCGGDVTAVRWPGGKWTLSHECGAPPRSRAQRFVEWRWAPDVVRVGFVLVLIGVLVSTALLS
jgi:hypothetical protein